MIGTLAEVKRAVQAGIQFEIVEHFIRPECKGQIRIPAKVTKTGFYSKIKGEPEDSPMNMSNDGKGIWMPFGKASDWEFTNGICTESHNGQKVWSIVFKEESDGK